MKRVLVLVAMTAALVLGTMLPASAVIHVTVPADECAPASSNAVSNATAEAVIVGLAQQGTVGLPLGGVKSAPTACPAP